jgi:hypothetical protein
MNRDNKGRFIKTNNDSMKLAIGDKITSSSQFREGMIISFDAHVHNGIRNKWVHLTNAIMVKDKNNDWYACHDNVQAIGNQPFFAIFDNREYNDQKQKEMMFDKEYSWQICFNEGGEDSKNYIFCGFHMPSPVKEVKPKYEIGDIVLVRESLINYSLCCCKIVGCIKENGQAWYTLHILTTPSPFIIYNFKEENIVKKIGIIKE